MPGHLAPTNEHSLATEYAADLIPKLVRTLWKSEKSLFLVRNRNMIGVQRICESWFSLFFISFFPLILVFYFHSPCAYSFSSPPFPSFVSSSSPSYLFLSNLLFILFIHTFSPFQDLKMGHGQR